MQKALTLCCVEGSELPNHDALPANEIPSASLTAALFVSCVWASNSQQCSSWNYNVVCVQALTSGTFPRGRFVLPGGEHTTLYLSVCAGDRPDRFE